MVTQQQQQWMDSSTPTRDWFLEVPSLWVMRIKVDQIVQAPMQYRCLAVRCTSALHAKIESSCMVGYPHLWPRHVWTNHISKLYDSILLGFLGDFSARFSQQVRGRRLDSRTYHEVSLQVWSQILKSKMSGPCRIILKCRNTCMGKCKEEVEKVPWTDKRYC